MTPKLNQGGSRNTPVISHERGRLIYFLEIKTSIVKQTEEGSVKKRKGKKPKEASIKKYNILSRQLSQNSQYRAHTTIKNFVYKYVRTVH